MKAGFLQFSPKRRGVSHNLTVIKELCEDEDFDLLILPELSNSGYYYESKLELANYSEPGNGNGEFLSGLREICKAKDACIVTGFAEINQDKIYNSAAAITRRGVIQVYRKVHLFNTEKDLFDFSETGFEIFSYNDTIIGMMICFDWFFPEAARSLALKGAQVIAHPSNLILPYCQDAMVTRSIENKVFTITSNRTGSEKKHTNHLYFTGKSQVTDPSGKVLIRAGEASTGCQFVEINPKIADNKNITPLNNLLQDRRPSMYK